MDNDKAKRALLSTMNLPHASSPQPHTQTPQAPRLPTANIRLKSALRPVRRAALQTRRYIIYPTIIPMYVSSVITS